MNFKTISFFIFLAFCIYGSENQSKKTSDDTVKRTIIIIPFYNQNKVGKYNYISEFIRDSLKTKLLENPQFRIIGFNTVQDKISDMGLTYEELANEKNAKSLAVKLKADVIIFGKYIIIEDQIKVQIDAVDIFTNETAASVNISGALGLDVFRIIDQSALDLSEQLKTKLKEVKKSYFIEMTRLLNKEKLLSFKANFIVLNKTGLGLTAGGGVLFLSGLVILIFDLSYYYDILKDNLYFNPRTDMGYNEYVNAYYAYHSLLGSSIALICAGILLTSIGIPFMIYKKKNKKTALNIKIGPEINIEICRKF